MSARRVEGDTRGADTSRTRRSAVRTDRGSAQAATTVVAGVLALVIGVVLLIVVILGDSADACGTPPGGKQPAPSDSANSIPGNYLTLYKQAGERYGIPWNVLAGIGKVETGHGTSTLPGVHSGANYAGAGGPMQFLQPTWDAFGVDGNGDGKKNRYDPADAIPGAANYLKASGAPGDLRKAIYAYNHSFDYVDLVLSWAEKYADGDYSVGGDNAQGQACVPGGDVAAGGPFGQRIIAYALKWRGVPYSWGGGRLTGPSEGFAQGSGIIGFDCSSLVQYAVYHASGRKITIPRVTQHQINAGRRIAKADMQPGDLWFPSLEHVGIYMGNGQIVEAPRTGLKIRTAPIAGRGFLAAVRISPPRGDV